MHRKTLTSWTLLLWCATALPAAIDATRVELDSGPVVGVAESELTVYRGIPFATPPVAELRWRPPRPPQPWSEPLVARAFGAACPQAEREDRPGVLGATSEDCLTLNLWVPPRADKPLPVMVWIHGGAFVLGSGSWPWYDGSELARRGVLVVTINYRIGRLGFFAHPALSALQSQESQEPLGNYGIMDQIAALEWVQRNIAAFGGDPANVTVFGESAGGASINLLLVAPQAKGLFHKAIAQSGGMGVHPDLRKARPAAGPRAAVPAEKLGEQFARSQGIDGSAGDAATAAALRALPISAIVPPQALGARVAPMIDGSLVVAEPHELFRAGKQHDVPLLLGANSFEGSLARTFGLSEAMIVRQLDGFGDRARALWDASNNEDWAFEIYGDATFVAPARWLARQASRRGTPVYLYHFSYVASARRGSVPGAAHGADVPFVFSTLARVPGASAEDRALAEAVTNYWTSFAIGGAPASPGDPAWPAYDSDQDVLLELGPEIAIRRGFEADKLDLLDQRFEALVTRSDGTRPSG